MSDYGNMVTLISTGSFTQWYKKTGRARVGHKYYNYKELNPEEFV